MGDSHFLAPRVLFEYAKELPNSAMLVYLCLCVPPEPERTRIALSTADLAARCGLTQRTIFAAVAQLEQVGLVEREKSRPTGVNEYHVIVPPHCSAKAASAPFADHSVTSQASGDTTAGVITACARPVQHESVVLPNEQKCPLVSQLKPLDDLIAAAYSDRCRLADVRAHVAVTDIELRACLEQLMAQGGVAPEMPVGFFAALIRKVRHEIYGGEIAR
jgi:hypothetical protein